MNFRFRLFTDVPQMDYHSLKRRELQALCKEHNIPANSANSVLADKLSALLNEKQKPITRKRTCIKSSVETTDEGEPAASKRQAKKVRFSPSNDLVEYELHSGEKKKDMVTQIKSRRNSVAKKVDKPVVDNTTTVELVDDSAQIPVKLTRSRVQLSGKDVIPNNEKKQNRREAKDVEKGTVVDKETVGNVGKVTRSKAHTSDIDGGIQREESRQSKRLNKDVEKASESVKETVVSRARVTRSKVQTSMEGGTGPDVNPHVKKKSGKQVEIKAQDVKTFEEIMDIPATRSRRQTIKEDVVNTDANPQADKKRTRREMKSTDLSSNSSNVAPVDQQEPPKRKSLRTREVETVDKDEGDKVEVVNNGRVTRSKAPLETEASGRNCRNKANKVEIQQPEEPSKNAGKKNVNRRKSVLQPVKTEVVLHLEEPLNRPARKNTRRTSVIQKVTKMVESPTVGKKQSNGQSGSLSMIVEGLEDVENVIRSGKDASENEFKKVISGSLKSRKQRGTPIIEDQIIKTEHGSFVDKSSKSSARSVSRSEGKSIVKKLVESSLKKPVSRRNNQSSVENGSKGKSWAVRSGAIVRDSSSKKRAKLSGMKQSDSVNRDFNSSKEGTPVAKMGNFKPDEEVTEPEVTPAIDKSDSLFTRRAIRSERKEPSQSAIKEQRFTRSTIKSERKEPSQSAFKQQPIAEAQLSSSAAKFQHDPSVNTAPGRITRRGIKHGVNAGGSFSEKVGKKKQTSRSAQKKQPLDDAQMASSEVAEVGPNPDADTIGVQSEIKQSLDDVQMSSPEVAEVGPNPGVDIVGVRSEIKEPYDDVQMCSPEDAEARSNPDSDAVEVGSEISKEVTGEILIDLSASESVRLPSKVMEENKVPTSGTSIDMESVSLVSVEKASGEVMEDAGACIEKSTHEASSTPCLTESLLAGKQQHPLELESFDDETPLGKSLFHIKMASVSVSDGSHVHNQNEEVYVESGIFSETVNLETSVLKSERPDAKEKEIELIGSGSTSKGLQTDVMIEESHVSVSKVKEGVDISSLGVATKGNNGDADGNCDPVSYDVGSSTINGPKELESGSELSNANKTIVVPISDNDVDIERVLEDNNDVQDGESEHDQLKSNDNHATDEEDVEGDDSEPAQNKCMPVVAELLVRSRDHEPEILNVADDVQCDTVGQSDSVASKDSPKTHATSGIDDIAVTVDAPEESVLDINKDVVSSILGDIYDDMDAEDDLANEQKSTEVDEGFQPKESGCISPDMSNEQTKEEAGTGGGNDHIMDDQEQAVAIDELDSDSVKSMVDGSHIGVNEVDSELVGNLKAPEDPTREEASPNLYAKGESAVDGIDSSPLMGDIGAHESLIIKESLPITYRKEESPVDDIDSDLQTIKEDDRNKQGTSVDWGDYDLVMDEFEKPVSANRSAEVVGEGEKDDEDSDLQTSARQSFSIEGSSGIAAGLASVVKNLEKDSENAADRKSKKDVDMLKESANAANMTEEVFNWSGADSSMRSLFATPTATWIGNLNGSQEDAVNLASQDTYSSLKSLFTTPATTRIGHAKNGQEDAVGFANQDHYSSLKPLFKTPAATQISHVKGGQEDAVSFANLDPYSSLKPLFKTPAATQISQVKDDRDDAHSRVILDPYSSLKSLFKTPAATQIGQVKDGQEDAVSLANQDPYSSLKPLFKTPAATQISHLKDGQGDAVSSANQDPYSSLKPLFTTPATAQISHVKGVQGDATSFAQKDQSLSLKPLYKTPAVTQISHVKDGRVLKPLYKTPAVTQISHVKDGREDAVANQDPYSSLKSLFTTPATSRTSHVHDSKAVKSVNFTFPYGRRNEDMGTSGTAAGDFNHQWENDQLKAFDSETQSGGPENEMYGVPSFEDYPLKLFGEEEVGGSYDGSRANTHFEFKGDQVDQIKQFEFLSEAAGTSNHDPSGLKDNSIHGCEFEKKEETDDDLACKTGHV
ncbi:hypothetical protein L1987_13892 [Smallanthus sonchifolius]|uniref:Uncharacterized protein n=1 Tax=Smallanthus sonchifolius TaxID=185202 RepID=A0ACB9JK07_9ASTR|nr:hypothetical protein L1987_13892 [Smallanthus sonchifolius]